MVWEMSTNVHVRYIHSQPVVHVGMNFSIFLYKGIKIVKLTIFFNIIPDILFLPNLKSETMIQILDRL